MLAEPKKIEMIVNQNLLNAIRDRDLVTVKLLLGEPPNTRIVNSREESCGTVFNFAVCYGSLEIVEFMAKVAQLNGYEEATYTPLDYAMSQSQESLIIFYRLLALGAHQVNHPVEVKKNRFRDIKI